MFKKAPYFLCWGAHILVTMATTLYPDTVLEFGTSMQQSNAIKSSHFQKY